MKDISTPIAFANQVDACPVARSVRGRRYQGIHICDFEESEFTLAAVDLDDNILCIGRVKHAAEAASDFPDGLNLDTDMFRDGGDAVGFVHAVDGDVSGTFEYAVRTLAMSITGKSRADFELNQGLINAWSYIKPRVDHFIVFSPGGSLIKRTAPVIGEYNGNVLYGPVVSDSATDVAITSGMKLGGITDYNSRSYTPDESSADLLALMTPLIDASASRLLTQERGVAVYLTADGAAFSGPCILRRVIIGTGTAGACIVYDNTAASGTIITNIEGTTPRTVEVGAVCANGIYVNLTSGQLVTVIYEPV